MLNAGTHGFVDTVCALEAIAIFLRTASADFAIASAEDEAEEEDEDEETDEVSESESESGSLELVSESESELELEELLSESELELGEDCTCGAWRFALAVRNVFEATVSSVLVRLREGLPTSVCSMRQARNEV